MKHLPPNLDNAFHDAMSRIQAKRQEQSELGIQTLVWVLYATRALTADELREALSVAPESVERDPTNRPSLAKILECCAGLVVVESGTNTIHFAHLAVEEWLRSKQLGFHGQLSEICITYLLFDEFEAGRVCNVQLLEQRLKRYPFLNYAARNWNVHVKGPAETDDKILQLINRLFASKHRFEMMREVRYTSKRDGEWLWQYPLDSYPVLFMIREGLLYSAERLVGGKRLEELAVRDSYGRNALHEACMIQSERLVKILVDLLPDSVNETDDFQISPLHFAAETGNMEIIKILVNANANIDALDRFGYSPFQRAVFSGHKLAAEFLFSTMRDSLKNTTDEFPSNDNSGLEILHQAATVGYEDGVKWLLVHGKTSPYERSSAYWDTPLHRAVTYGHTGVVKILLQYVDVGKLQEDGLGSSPLHLAAKHGRDDIVDLLLSSGKCVVSARDSVGFSPLHWAAAGGYLSIFAKLFPLTELAMEIECPTPWELACWCDNVQIREYIVQHSSVGENCSELFVEETRSFLLNRLHLLRHNSNDWQHIHSLCQYLAQHQISKGEFAPAVAWLRVGIALSHDVEATETTFTQLERGLSYPLAWCDNCDINVQDTHTPFYICICEQCNKLAPDSTYDLCEDCYEDIFLLPKMSIHNQFLRYPLPSEVSTLEEEVSKLNIALGRQ